MEDSTLTPQPNGTESPINNTFRYVSSKNLVEPISSFDIRVPSDDVIIGQSSF